MSQKRNGRFGLYLMRVLIGSVLVLAVSDATPPEEYYIGDFVAPQQAVAVFFVDRSDGAAILDGLGEYMEGTHDQRIVSVERWRPVKEIVWSIETAGAYIDKDYIESAIMHDGGFEIDLPMRFVSDPDAEGVDVVFVFGEAPVRCFPYKFACVNRIGAIYDSRGACKIALPDERWIYSETMTYLTLPTRIRQNVSAIEVVQHEFGHCLGLTHELDGVMSRRIWEPDAVTPPSKLEREVAQRILDELRKRVV